MMRGADRRAPVLLWLHGGPGGAERPLFRYFDADLERDFVVAYWDQRGAGRSFDAKADPRALTIARHLTDLDAIVDHLARNLDRKKIILMGHSWGAALGLLYAQAHPDKVAAVVAVAPMISGLAQQRAQYDFVAAEASQRDDRDALSQLRSIGPPPHANWRDALAMEKLADEYGGLYHRRPNQAWVMTSGILRGLVTPWEIPRFIRGNNVSLEAMHDELLELDLSHSLPAVDVPVVFFLGDTIGTSMLRSQHAISIACAPPASSSSGSRTPRTTYRSRSPNCLPTALSRCCDRSTSASDRIDQGQPGTPARATHSSLNVHKRCATAGSLASALHGSM